MTDKKIKVLHYMPGYKYGGIEARFVDWLKFFNLKKYEFTVVVNTDPNGSYFDSIRNHCKIIKIDKISIKSVSNHKNQLKEILSSNSYDIIHSHSLDKSYFLLK